MNLRIEPTREAKELLWKLERKKAFRDQFESAAEFIEFSLKAAWVFTTSIHLGRSKTMISFSEYCRQLDEKKDTEKRMEDAYKKKQRERKIRKLLAFDSHWKNLS